MESGVKTKRLKIGGMTCINCQNKIERKLRNAAGVKNVKVSYSAGTADIAYDTDIISLKDITAIIEKLDYQVLTGNEKQESNVSRVVGILVIVVSLYVLLQQFGVLNLLVPSQLADTKMGYGMLFVIGLITSIHCIAMCGGINLSQCIPQTSAPAEKQSRMATFVPAFLYNLGRVISYTVIGFILGFVGLLFGGGGSDAGLPVMAQGILKLIAGVFMVIMGINMLGLFPWLRKLQPHMPKIFGRKVGKEKAKSKSPLFVGLLNGLMPCGPLQSMQIVALASGNPIAGALSMLLFSLGTVPLMLGLGSIVSALGKKFTQKVMTVGAVLVVVLGLAMLSQGGSLSGFLLPDRLLTVVLALCAVGIVSSIPFKKPNHKTVSTVTTAALAVLLIAWSPWNAAPINGGIPDGGIQVVDGKQIVTSTLSAGSFPNITVEAGTPVKWTINAPSGSINGCNNRINIGEYDISNYSFKQGDNVIEFTPDKTGRFQYSCWMGMIRGSITVVEPGADPTANADDGLIDEYSDDNAYGGTTALDPTPAGITIPTDNVTVAKLTTDEEYGDEIQEVTIELTDKGFSPAIIIVQAGLDVKRRKLSLARAFSVLGGG
jgi:sulfite exporter TauE/SafE/copper chaperone CopZ